MCPDLSRHCSSGRLSGRSRDLDALAIEADDYEDQLLRAGVRQSVVHPRLRVENISPFGGELLPIQRPSARTFDQDQVLLFRMPVGTVDGLARLHNGDGSQHVLRARRLAREVAPHLAPVGLVRLGVLEADNARLEGLALRIGSLGPLWDQANDRNQNSKRCHPSSGFSHYEILLSGLG